MKNCPGCKSELEWCIEHQKAERAANEHVPMGAIAYKYADPIEDARWVFDEDDYNEIKSQDPSLLVDIKSSAKSNPDGITCSNCGRIIRIPKSLKKGYKLICSHCNNYQIVPSYVFTKEGKVKGDYISSAKSNPYKIIGKDGWWDIEYNLEEEDSEDSALEHIASLIKEGYTSGYSPYWKLSYTGVDELFDTDLDHIAELVEEGYHSGEIIQEEEIWVEPKKKKKKKSSAKSNPKLPKYLDDILEAGDDHITGKSAWEIAIEEVEIKKDYKWLPYLKKGLKKWETVMSSAKSNLKKKHTIGYCKKCKGGHSLIDGLCYDCRKSSAKGNHEDTNNTFETNE